jgi:transposase-like protein
MDKFVKAGDFCPTEKCSDYGKLQNQTKKLNIIKHGTTKSGRKRYKCKTCGHTFTETKGTIFYRKRTAERKIIETLAWIAEGARISSISRVKGHKEDTIISWLREAKEHADAIEEVLMSEHKIDRGQIDGLWSYVGNKGEKMVILKQKAKENSGVPR